jgi:hypothetical protein
MTHTLKLIVSSLLAVVALAAVVSAAGAAAPTLKTPGHSGATISGAQIGNHIFTFGSPRELECGVATFSGALSGESSTTLELTPTYDKCKTKAVLGVSFPATVQMNGCTYLLHGEANATREALGEFAANVDLVCPSGKEVVLDVNGAAACSLTVPPFSGHLGTTIRNAATFIKSVEVATNVSATANGSGGICGGSGQTSTYKGETSLTAHSAGVSVPLEALKGP